VQIGERRVQPLPLRQTQSGARLDLVDEVVPPESIDVTAAFEYPAVERIAEPVSIGNRNAQMPARFQDASDLVDGASVFLEVLERMAAHHHVDAGRGDRQPLGVAQHAPAAFRFGRRGPFERAAIFVNRHHGTTKSQARKAAAGGADVEDTPLRADIAETLEHGSAIW
jgi:hypothetical protein